MRNPLFRQVSIRSSTCEQGKTVWHNLYYQSKTLHPWIAISSFHLQTQRKSHLMRRKRWLSFNMFAPILVPGSNWTHLNPSEPSKAMAQVPSYEDNVEEVKSTPTVVQSVQTSVVSFNASRQSNTGRESNVKFLWRMWTDANVNLNLSKRWTIYVHIYIYYHIYIYVYICIYIYVCVL